MSFPEAEALNSFDRLFGRPALVTADAPGRVNLIGEHTDYNGGFVLPLAVSRRTRVDLAPRPDKKVRAYTLELGGPTLEFQLGSERRRGSWIDYVQGVTRAVAQAGCSIDGFDLRIRSDLPLGAGLSSSAALEVSLLRGLRLMFQLELDDVRLALLGQQAENDFVGARVGIMDQFTASLGDDAHALLVNTRALSYEKIPLPEELGIIVVNSGVSHSHAHGEYNTRRAECEQACRLLGVDLLSDLMLEDLPRASALPAPLNKRARHVVSENARVHDAVASLRSGDLARLGQLLHASHRSLRDDYEVSIPELDSIVALASREPSVYGARLTGGGFGGSVLIAARRQSGREVAQRVAERYSRQTGRNGSVL